MKCSLLTLSTFIDTELPPRNRGEVEAHLVACERCSRAVGHLREESERIARLGRVTVADHSVQTLMEQLGLIREGAEMPARTAAPVVEATHDGPVPPWLSGDVGQALPWRAKKAVPRAIMPRVAPREAQAKPNDTEPESDTKEGGSQPISDEVTEVDAKPEPLIDNFIVEPRQPSSQPDTRQLEPSFQLEPWAPPVVDDGSAVLTSTPDYDDEAEMPPLHPHESIPAAFSAPENDENFDVSDDEPSDYELAAQPQTPQWQPPTRPVKVQRGFFDKIRDAIEIRRAVRRAAEVGDVEVVSGFGAPNVDVSPRRRVAQARDAAQQERRLQSAAAAAAPPSIERLRDNLEMKPAEIAPVEISPVEFPPADIPVAASGPAFATAAKKEEEAEVSLDDLRQQALRRELPWQREEEGIDARERRSFARPTLPRPAISVPRPRIPDLKPALGGVGMQVKRVSSLGSMDQRLIALGAGAVLLIAIGLATGKTTSAIKPANATATLTAPPVHHTTAAPKNSAPPAAQSSAAPVQSAQPQQLTNVQTLGKGGTGFAIGDVRYGQHTGYFRIVFDLSGGSGTPTTVIGFKSPTVMDVVFSGTSPSGATGLLPNTTTVTNVTILPRTTAGQTVYEFTLAHAVTAHPSFGFGPTRLIIDLT